MCLAMDLRMGVHLMKSYVTGRLTKISENDNIYIE